jgi:hypothetical protein
VKPQLKKGDKVILEGEFNSSKDSNRPSFTCYSYQILSSERIERTKDSSDQVISHGK